MAPWLVLYVRLNRYSYIPSKKDINSREMVKKATNQEFLVLIFTFLSL